MITLEQFEQHVAKKEYTLIPVAREILSDLDTPLSVYLKLAYAPNTFLFESVDGGEDSGRYSIIGLPARRVYRFYGYELETWELGELIERRHVSDPLAEVEALCQAQSVAQIEGLPDVNGGLFGWFGFECIAYIEPHLASDKPDELNTPDILLMQVEELAVFDNLNRHLYLIVHADPRQERAWAKANHRLDELSHRLRQAGAGYSQVQNIQPIDEQDFKPSFSREQYHQVVRTAQEYIRAGDIFQVVPSQRLHVPFQAAPLDVYRALRLLNPSPYMYFIDTGSTQVVGASPETLVRLRDGMITMHPIAGTRPRGSSPQQDQALAEELQSDPKERAEHLMLIDLGRNDIGHVAQAGSVKVKKSFEIERYSHVMHMVSEVTGQLKPGLNYIDVLRATFPAGTVSGAPKIRALQIIQELEPMKRNVYSGAVGYIGWNGNADTAIAIRTAVIQGSRLYVQAGGGVVYDSDPDAEWQETMNKARALFRAITQAARGL